MRELVNGRSFPKKGKIKSIWFENGKLSKVDFRDTYLLAFIIELKCKV